jgi:hypothetical protein
MVVVVLVVVLKPANGGTHRATPTVCRVSRRSPSHHRPRYTGAPPQAKRQSSAEAAGR